jgi:hypothetical protein
VDRNRFDRLTRSFSTLLSRRSVAGLLGIGALALPNPTVARKKHHKHHKHKHKKTHFKGDSRCQGRNVISADGICIDLEDQAELALATCSALQACLCATDANGTPACIVGGGPACETTCLSDDDCDPGTLCVELAGCCHPELARSCAVPCPPL